LGGDDSLLGGDGNDTLDGGSEADFLSGGLGSDTATYANASAGVIVSLTTGFIEQSGDAFGDTFSSIENIIGSNSSDVLVGDIENNIIHGGGGSDNMDGRDGFDIASYMNASGAVTVNLGISGLQNTGSAGLDTLSNFEGILGSSSGDTLTGNDADNWIEGGGGNDSIDGGLGIDIASYLHASEGVTVDLTTSGPQDTGSAGTDTLVSIEGLEGSAFNDTFTVSASSPPSSVDGGNDVGNGGDVLVLQDLVHANVIVYDFTDLAGLDSRLENIETLNIRNDGADTLIAITGQDVLNMIDTGSQLTVQADNGDTLDLTAFVAAGETYTPTVIDANHIDYAIFNGFSEQIAQIHWQTA